MVRPDRHVEVVAEGLAFLEGPRWHGGRLYVSDFFLHRVFALDDGQLREVCEVEQQPSGLGWDQADRLAIVSMNDRRLLRLEDGRLEEWADLSSVVPGPLNDLVIDRHGRAYVGNIGSDLAAGEPLAATRLTMVGPEGSVRPVGDDLVFPNGAVITPDGGTLIVAESFACRLSAFAIEPDGELSNRRIWAEFQPRPSALSIEAALQAGAPIPDGIALDAEGAVWIADAAGSGAHRVREGGEIVDFIDTGELATFAVALGGEDRRTLYMCAGPPVGQIEPAIEHRSSLLACRVDVPGAGLP